MDNHDPVRRDELNSAPQEAAAQETSQALGPWLAANGWILAIVFALFVYLYIQFDWYGLGAIAKAFLGLSFVIFLHELGHFLAAKWCDVHVTTFSIGFGPAIPGCSFKWGETTWKFALLPLGGYVQMVGQVDGDESSDETGEDDPRSFRNKSVGQRMLIISAGVIMNVILAVVCFIVVFLGPGKNRKAGVVAGVDSGSSAFQQGVPTGAEIIRIDGLERPHFESLVAKVMNTGEGQQLEFIYRLPNQDPVTLHVEARKGPNDLKPAIGIIFSHRPELEIKTHLSPSMKRPVWPGSAAAKADPGFEWGDKFIAMTDPNTGQVTALPDDPRFPGQGQKDIFEFWRRTQDLAGQSVTIRVERDGKSVDVQVPKAFRHSLGVRMQMGQIVEVRQGSAAAKASIQLAAKGLEGDLIEEVTVKDADGKVKTWKDDALDPERLPFELRQWANRMAKAQKPDWRVALKVRRHRSGDGPQYKSEDMILTWDDTWKYDRVTPFNVDSPMPIVELGLAYRIMTTVAGIDSRLFPSHSLKPGDVIKKIRVTTVGVEDEENKGRFVEMEPGQWAAVAGDLPYGVKKVDLVIVRDKNEQEITVVPVEDETWPSSKPGLIFQEDLRLQKASGLVEAVQMGFIDTYDNVMRVFQNMRSIVTGRVSVKVLSGPITIARLAWLIAMVDSWEFVFFLGMISINLAVINFLPIPVLDGGHMVFLIYEKLRGKPASEGVRIAATYAGLALILCLMVFVFYLDITRLF